VIDIEKNNNHNPDSDGPDVKSINRLLFGEGRRNLDFEGHREKIEENKKDRAATPGRRQ